MCVLSTFRSYRKPNWIVAVVMHLEGKADAASPDKKDRQRQQPGSSSVEARMERTRTPPLHGACGQCCEPALDVDCCMPDLRREHNHVSRFLDTQMRGTWHTQPQGRAVDPRPLESYHRARYRYAHALVRRDATVHTNQPVRTRYTPGALHRQPTCRAVTRSNTPDHEQNRTRNRLTSAWVDATTTFRTTSTNRRSTYALVSLRCWNSWMLPK